uniref:NADH-ubiquinone oxidoreductase chain 2 n=1 Tax=Lasius niger TaxID=67767 RepID=A0A7M4C8T3_LASNI|nr:NADH dehydrogenase subunit 2 [Lasius niger]
MLILMLIFNMFLKYFILLILIMFSLIPMFSYDLLMIWFFMEINNFSFICYMCMKMKTKKMIFLYYIIQVLASLMLIFPLIINNFYLISQNLLILNFYFSLMMKLGIPPFHFWMIISSTFMSWEILFIFLSIQKIIPFYMFSLIEIKILILYLMILSSSYFSVMKMINLLNFKMLLTYSSINQTSWMLLLIFFKNLFWLTYMLIYSMILFMISIFMLYFKFTFNFNLNFSYNMNFNFICLMLLFNIASIPPLTFFFMKWFSIFIMLFNSELFFIFILMMFNSFILIYIYINMMSSMMFFISFKSKLLNLIPSYYYNFLNSNNNLFLLFMSFFLSLYMILI